MRWKSTVGDEYCMGSFSLLPPLHPTPLLSVIAWGSLLYLMSLLLSHLSRTPNSHTHTHTLQLPASIHLKLPLPPHLLLFLACHT